MSVRKFNMFARLGSVAALTVLATPAHAQRFPYHSEVFFQECAHLADARHGESDTDLAVDLGCARYIEGFEMGMIEAAHLPQTCMADPLSLLRTATGFYQNDPSPADMPSSYLAKAVTARCTK